MTIEHFCLAKSKNRVVSQYFRVLQSTSNCGLIVLIVFIFLLLGAEERSNDWSGYPVMDVKVKVMVIDVRGKI